MEEWFKSSIHSLIFFFFPPGEPHASWTEEPGGVQSMRSHRDKTEATSHAHRLL